MVDRAPSWSELTSLVRTTETGARLEEEQRLRSVGLGPPHPRASLRLFDGAEHDVRVTFYRDDAAWCPYCQKVWIALEEKRIPYRVHTLPLHAYGDKPTWYTRLVDGGNLPALELSVDDGRRTVVVTESLDMIRLLDRTFPAHGATLVPDGDQAAAAEELLRLEAELQSVWFSLVFYPVEGDALVQAEAEFVQKLRRVEDALGSTDGPWFLGGSEAPSIVDLQYVSHLERMYASVLYWRGLELRDTGHFPNLDRWWDAFDDRPSYAATKSDVYTLITAMPSQNGPGYFSVNANARTKAASSAILGLDGAWSLPLDQDRDDNSAAHRHEAAFVLTSAHAAVTAFAARGAGEPGRPSYHAELADPRAELAANFVGPVDVCLRHVAAALLDVTTDTAGLAGRAGDGALREDWDEYANDDGRVYWWNEATGESVWQAAPTQQLDTCLAYLRDRIGVPRDLGAGAAVQLRAHLNRAIEWLQAA